MVAQRRLVEELVEMKKEVGVEEAVEVVMVAEEEVVVEAKKM